MIDKRCTRCGGLNAAHANFCSACGAQEFVEASAEQRPDISRTQGAVPDNNVLRLSVPRLIVLSVVTSGVYILYWLYVTWKQLQAETRDIHYPVWHALTFFVPVYGLFPLYKHVRVVQELAMKVGVDTSLTPGLAVVLVALYWMVSITSGGVQSLEAFVILNLIRLALITTVIVWAQVTLNRYWSSIKGEALENVPIGSVEVRFVLLVLFIQLTLTFFVE